MKSKILVCALALIMALLVTGCGSDTPGTGADTKEATTVDVTKNAKTVKGDNLNFTLQYAKQYDKIEDPENEFLNADPDEGKVFLVLFCEVENISSESDYINMFYQTGKVDGKKCDQETILTDPDGYERLSDDLPAGQKLKGYACYQVDPSWKEFEFIYKDGVADDAQEYTFKITPEDLV